MTGIKPFLDWMTMFMIFMALLWLPNFLLASPTSSNTIATPTTDYSSWLPGVLMFMLVGMLSLPFIVCMRGETDQHQHAKDAAHKPTSCCHKHHCATTEYHNFYALTNTNNREHQEIWSKYILPMLNLVMWYAMPQPKAPIKHPYLMGRKCSEVNKSVNKTRITTNRVWSDKWLRANKHPKGTHPCGGQYLPYVSVIGLITPDYGSNLFDNFNKHNLCDGEQVEALRNRSDALCTI